MVVRTVVVVVVLVVVIQHGGWWYGKCTASVVTKDDLGRWKTVGATYDVQASRMLVKLN